MNFQIVSAGSEVARQMITALDADLLLRYPKEAIYGIDAESFEASGGVFVIGYEGEVPVACGGILPVDDAIEIKRLFVVRAFRRRGLSRLMMRFLEAEAVKRGYKRGVLETGKLQPEAINLYRSEGWREIPPFGPYIGDPRSVCFEKSLYAASLG